MQQSGATRVARVFVIGATSISLLLLCIQSAFLRWYADDFLYAASTRVNGFGGAQLWWYTQWSGRFAYTFIATALLELGPALAGIIGIVTILALVGTLTRRVGLPVALAATYTLFLGSPDFQQTAFWFTGMLTYVTPLIGLVWWTFVRLPDENAHPIDFVLPLLLSGFSEAGALCNIVYFAVAGLAWRRRSCVIACLAAVTAFTIIAIAPGNAIRLAQHHQEISLRLALETLRAVRAYFVGVGRSLAFPMILVFATAALFAPRASNRIVVAAASCAIATTLVVYGVVFAAMGQVPPGRVLVLPHAFLIAAAAALGARMPQSRRWHLALTVAIIMASLSAPLFDSWETAFALPEHHRRAQAWDVLSAGLERVPGRDVIVAHVPTMVGTLRFITHDRDDVMNVAVARYYGLQSIAAAPPLPSTRFIDPKTIVHVRWTGPPG